MFMDFVFIIYCGLTAAGVGFAAAKHGDTLKINFWALLGWATVTVLLLVYYWWH